MVNQKRMCKIISPIFLSLTFFACSNSSNKNKFSRVDMIYKAISLMEKGNSDSLKFIVDTTYCYEIYSKEGFDKIVSVAKNRLKSCRLPARDELRVSSPTPLATQYVLSFCQSQNDSTSNGFDLIFTFYDSDETEIIGFLNLKNLLKNNINLPKQEVPQKLKDSSRSG